jgi:hypothetical protein
MPISLSDDELQILLQAAAPIRTRDQFLRDVAIELAKFAEVLPGREPDQDASADNRGAHDCKDAEVDRVNKQSIKISAGRAPKGEEFLGGGELTMSNEEAHTFIPDARAAGLTVKSFF